QRRWFLERVSHTVHHSHLDRTSSWEERMKQSLGRMVNNGLWISTIGCCCPRQGLLVLCESLGLRSLPISVPLNTSVLSVARNQLCNVDHQLRPFTGLQELSLSHNHLAHFPRGLPPSLETLQLQENRITFITTGALRQLGNLTRLDLEDNRIRAIQPGALLRLGRLKVLTLKGNQLTSLPRNLPASLTHLDLSANCISALDLPSLNALVNLQVLKINSNCLRSVPETAFDGLPRLHSVELANNLWVCECDILYLYWWLLSGRLKMATGLVCAEPTHLAHRMILTLSVMAICPRVLKPNEKSPFLSFATRPEMITSTVVTTQSKEAYKDQNNNNLTFLKIYNLSYPTLHFICLLRHCPADTRRLL
uniref:Si:ch211-191d15.2 n=1 Tax=Esox lucius TaxID=8010 RepID=A0AAY5KTX4_ESOLU